MARKPSTWAKAAGEFYRKNKGKNGINSFTDVLQSSAFKTSYYAKQNKSNSRKRGGESVPTKTETPMTGGGDEDVDVAVPNKTEAPVSGGEETVAPEPTMTGGKRKTRGKKSSRKGRKTAKRNGGNK